jgi:undecaprenyl diphosphate synthase
MIRRIVILSVNVPKHVAIIMDGNGRWAKKRFLPRPAGHKIGVESAKKVIEAAARAQIDVLTLFVFSPENWRRPRVEINTILQLFLRALTEDIHKLHQNNIKLRVIGNIAEFPLKLQEAIHAAEKLTANNTGLTLVLAANYGGLWDLTQAMQVIAKKIAAQILTPEDITQTLIHQHLVTHDLPDPDLFIRTSGEQRISNFYLWQLSYSELYFTQTSWPDFDEGEFQKALDYFANRERRYGYTSEQLGEHSA